MPQSTERADERGWVSRQCGREKIIQQYYLALRSDAIMHSNVARSRDFECIYV